MEKTKIVFFLPHLVGGGAERVTINIIKQLDKKLHDVTLIVLSKNGPAYKLLPNDLHIIELNVNKTLFSIFKLRKIINNIKPDILFSSLFRGHIALYFSLLGIHKRPKLILRSPNSPKLVLEKNEISPFMKKLLDIVYKKADKIIAQTPEMKDEIIKYHNINSSKIEVFLNPIDKELIMKNISNIINPFEINKINVVAAGRLTPQKGFDVLIKSFHKVVALNKNFVLHIIGEDQGEEKNLNFLIKKYSLQNNVLLYGYQDNPYKFFYYSDMYVLSSRWEGMPNTVIENIFLKKPVIATKCIPFIEKLISNNINGFLVNVENEEELAQAILNYKNLDSSNNSLSYDKDINDIFRENL